MLKHAVASVLLVALLSSCPTANSAFIGKWTVTILNSDRGLELLPNGEAEAFVIDVGMTGDLTWRIDGDQFILTGRTGGPNYVMVANANSSMMSGAEVTYSGQNTGGARTWTAVKQP